MAQIPQGFGTPIGSMTEHGGLAACFDGVTSQAQSAGSYKTNTSTGFDIVTIGKDWGAGSSFKVNELKMWAPSDVSVNNSTGASYKLQGSNDSSSWTDLFTSGTVLATAGSTVDQTTGITVTTAYRFHRVNWNATANDFRLAEVQFFASVLAPSLAVANFALTGNAVKRAFGLPCAKATFVLTGFGVVRAFVLPCAQAAFTLTGMSFVFGLIANTFKRRQSADSLYKSRVNDETLEY